MATSTGDIRYRARCARCNKPLDDWALSLPEEKRLCWNHKKFDLKVEKKPFSKG